MPRAARAWQYSPPILRARSWTSCSLTHRGPGILNLAAPGPIALPIHRAYLHATRQAFLEAYELAFAWSGGVFRRLRYDELKAAVTRILRGNRREETERFIAFRSHWGFAAEFCTHGEGHEKGGVEGEGGYLRGNHLVPVQQVRDLAEFNELLLAGCNEDARRVIGERSDAAGELMLREREHLGRLVKGSFDVAEVSFPEMDGDGCVPVRDEPLFDAIAAWNTGGSEGLSGLCRALGGRPARGAP